jgi:hypothetical protein
MTKEDLLNKPNHSLRMKDLRKFVEANKDLDDDAPCLVERVEDRYFEKRPWHDGTTIGGWDVLKVEGYHYHSSLEWNRKMQKEIDRRGLGEEPEYGMENPLKCIFGEKKLEAMKEQFYQAFGITTDSKIVYIYSHY